MDGVCGEISSGLSQPQPWPQPELFFVKTSRATKTTSVTNTIAAAVIVCQLTLKSEKFTALEDDE